MGEHLSKLRFNHLLQCYPATTHDFYQGLLVTNGNDRKLNIKFNLNYVKIRIHKKAIKEIH